jgi:hypothetical protein
MDVFAPLLTSRTQVLICYIDILMKNAQNKVISISYDKEVE